MRNRRHDYGKKHGIDWGWHGEAEFGPDKYGERMIYRLNGHTIFQSDLIAIVWSAIEAERIDEALWRMGDPKRPEPITSILGELGHISCDRMMAEARLRDAEWDKHDAAVRERRLGTAE